MDGCARVIGSVGRWVIISKASFVRKYDRSEVETLLVNAFGVWWEVDAHPVFFIHKLDSIH